jgi:hypothetical protein
MNFLPHLQVNGINPFSPFIIANLTLHFRKVCLESQLRISYIIMPDPAKQVLLVLYFPRLEGQNPAEMAQNQGEFLSTAILTGGRAPISLD